MVFITAGLRFRLFGSLFGSVCGSVCLAGVLPLAFAAPAPAAERVTLTYGLAEISTSVAALKDYAESGEVNEELAPYLRFLNEAQRSQFRAALQVRQDVSPVEISQFLYSSIGDNILRSLGDIVRTQSRRNGAKGLRGALVLAAAEPGGLSIIGVLEQFPTDNVRIDSQRVFQAINGFSGLIGETRQAIAAIEQQASTIELGETSANLPDLAAAGPYPTNVQTFTVVDELRNRTLELDLYLPQSSPQSSPEAPALSPAPLVIASHGLAGDREGFDVIGEHLASHGFAVAALDHPESDRAQFTALLAGRANEIAEPTEFTERPRDISYLIDELTRLNMPGQPFANRLDTDRIGVIGHSFGGYTALAVAGAQLNFDTLAANCDSTAFIFNAANTSMLLQCTALAAPEQFSADLRDERVQAVMAMNPIASSLFGPEGFAQIEVPSLSVAGSADPIAPALLEQIRPFVWLNEAKPTASDLAGSEHYLALIEGGSHLYELPELENADISFANSFASPDIPLTNSYLRALSLGFMQTTIAQNDAYRDALTGSSIVRVGQQALPLYVINTLTEAMLQPLPEAVEEPVPLPIEEPENLPAETERSAN